MAPHWVRSVVLESRLAGPSHPARPDPPLVAPRDPQEHVVDHRGELQTVQMWHDAAGPDPSQVPIFIIFELVMKNYILSDRIILNFVTNNLCGISRGPWLLFVWEGWSALTSFFSL